MGSGFDQLEPRLQASNFRIFRGVSFAPPQVPAQAFSSLHRVSERNPARPWFHSRCVTRATWPEEPQCWPEFRDRRVGLIGQPETKAAQSMFVAVVVLDQAHLHQPRLVGSHWLFEDKESGMILSHLRGDGPTIVGVLVSINGLGHLKILLTEIRLRFL